MSLHRAGFWAAAAVVAALACPAPALAGQELLLDGQHVERRSDPFVPSNADLARPPGHAAPVARTARSSAGRRALGRALRRARRAHRISRARYRRYVRIYHGALRALRRLHGSRRRQLAYVVSVAERLAVRHRLVSSRLPAVFLLLRRNTQFWRSRAFPGTDAKVRFRGSEILFQYYPGRGIQLQPLVNFKKANLLHGACEHGPDCPAGRMAHLLDELIPLATRRSRRFIAWEYYFDFGGGSPPWMSAMAQATALQAFVRGSDLLHRPGLRGLGDSALGAFSTPAPVGVRARGFRGGRHYLQYSFARRYFIFNAFGTAVTGLRDFARGTGSHRAMELYEAAKPEAIAEMPASDVGDWTLYSYRGPESRPDYHELLREVVAGMCTRHIDEVFCTLARRYRAYQTDPAVLRIDGPATATQNARTSIRFWVSKRSVVQAVVTKDGNVGLDETGTFRRGGGSFAWRPRSSGLYRIRLSAKELRTGRGLRTRTERLVEVAPG